MLTMALTASLTFSDCNNCSEMASVPAGQFEMGSDNAETDATKLDAYFADREKPRHTVQVAAFAMALHEVTRAQFAQFVSEAGYTAQPGCFVFEGSQWRFDSTLDWKNPGFAQRSDEPAVCISKRDAEAYVNWISRKTGRSYRLPSEAEWEYTARAGSSLPYIWDRKFSHQMCRFVNGGDKSTELRFHWAGKSMNLPQVPPWRPLACDDGYAATAPVMSFRPNAWGFYHMIGNVQEWVGDCLNPNHQGAPGDAKARTSGDCTKGILKGQGWTATGPVLRPAFRLNGAVSERRFSWGFRLAADLTMPVLTQPPAYQPQSPDARANYSPLERVGGNSSSKSPPQLLSKLDWSQIDQAAQANGTYALLVWQGGSIRHERYFNGADADSRSEPASMAKTVMALAVGKAIESGRIRSVDMPLSELFPEWAKDDRASITLRDVLQMRSGLEPLSRDGSLSDTMRFQFGDQMAELALGQRLMRKPGSYFEYQNSVSQLACLALERATGERYAQFLSRALWKPMGAGDAWVWLDRSNAHARCYASLLARPLDWLKIGILLKDHGKLQGRQLVAGSWIDQMLAPSPTNPAYGMQVWRGSAFASKRFYNGDSTGFAIASAAPFPWPDVTYLDGFGGQRVYISRCADVVIVRLGRFVADWDDTSLPIQVGKLLERKTKNRCRKT